jgi:hypothetical protein
LVTQVLTPDDVAIRSIRSLGFDPSQVAINDPVVLAALVRRFAAFLAPCSARVLRDRVAEGVNGIAGADEISGEAIDEMINALVSYGDLLDLPTRDGEGSGTVLYLAQPSFVRRESGTVFLFGIAPDGRSLLPAGINARVQYRVHTRRIEPDPGEDLAAVLRGFGIQELPEKLWFKKPRSETADGLVARFDQLLTSSGHAGELDGLLVLDSERPVQYYRGRWVTPGRLTGRFVARRERRYGSPMWSYVELEEGRPKRLHDILPREWRPCDYAWQLQLAIDHRKGHPQVFRPIKRDGGRVVVSFFSPVPRWARMRWDIIGEPLEETGSLFSYVLASAEYEIEYQALTRDLWMRELIAVKPQSRETWGA